MHLQGGKQETVKQQQRTERGYLANGSSYLKKDFFFFLNNPNELKIVEDARGKREKIQSMERRQLNGLVSPPLELTHGSLLALDLAVFCKNLFSRKASSPGPWSIIHREISSVLW